MPEWKYFRDRAGNTFYIDRNGKIYTIRKPVNPYQIITSEGIEYSLSYGKEVLSVYPVEGLIVLKSILILPEKNNMIIKAQNEASMVINNCLKKNGDRFHEWDKDASLLMVRYNNTTHIVDDEMRFSFEIPYHIQAVRTRERENLHYKYSGLSLCITVDSIDENKDNEYSGFDMVMAVDSESFSARLSDVYFLEENWRNNLGFESLQRSIIEVNKFKKVYKIVNNDEPRITGFEGYYINNNIGYMLRILCSEAFFQTKKEQIYNIVKSFKTSRLLKNY